MSICNHIILPTHCHRVPLLDYRLRYILLRDLAHEHTNFETKN